jgi:acetolactate synthase I/II/III large subunit
MPNRAADQIAQALSAAGVTHVFSLSGNQIMSLYDALFEVGMNIIHVRHEAAAVHMADAWGRITGTPGVALVTAGPGHANAVSALFTARGCDAPMIMLSGHAPTTLLGKGAFQEMDQAAMAAPACKAAWTPTTTEALVAAIPRALAMAVSGQPGPVQISMPVNLLEGPGAPAPAPVAKAAVDAGSVHAAVEQLQSLLGDAQKPLIIAGPNAMRGTNWTELQTLRALGIPVIGAESPRGLKDPALGAFAEVLPAADLLILIEKPLDFTIAFGASPAIAENCKIFDVQPDEAQARRSRANAAQRLCGQVQLPAGALVPALQTALTTTAYTGAASWAAEVDAAVSYRPSGWSTLDDRAAGAMHPAALFARVQAHMDQFDDWTLIADGGEVGQWAQACLQAPVRLINGVGGSIGSGVPLAIAAQIARPEVPAIVVVGDGTFGFHIAELDTAARYGVPITVLVCNDAKWNAEYQIQLRDYGANRLIGCELRPTPYAQVCAPFGVHAEQVDRAEQFDAALARAVASTMPAVVNVALDGQAAPNLARK